jgi:hypothetical protein
MKEGFGLPERVVFHIGPELSMVSEEIWIGDTSMSGVYFVLLLTRNLKKLMLRLCA